MPPPQPPQFLPNDLASAIPKQDAETLEALQNYLDDLLAYRRGSIDTAELPDDAEPVEHAPSGPGTVVSERVKCGADCTCNDGRGHGPYLYRYYRKDGSLTSEYLGKA